MTVEGSRADMKYEELEQLVKMEVIQREEEGCDIAEAKEALSQIKRKSSLKLRKIMRRLSEANPSANFPYREPSDLPGIKAERPKGPRKEALNLSDEELLDKIHGGWLGRCAGCLLGKPVEGAKKEHIEEWLNRADAYPLRDYFPPLKEIYEMPDWLKNRLKRTNMLLGNIDRMVRDDDIDYTIIGLHILETVGSDFTAADVGKVWLVTLPYLSVYTAERIAYRNLVNGLVPTETATYMNPYREWIGAQIRADMWGYVASGNPEIGAELAYRDASLSHVKNGIYGEMFVSAMLSAAFATGDIEEIIEIGLSEIPKQSRLAEAMRNVVAWSKELSDWREAWSKIMAEYGHYHLVHTINNAALVLLGLLYGEGDYEKSIAISVMSGLDTDCTGATTGSIVGVMLGAKNLPKKWIAPLNDRAESFVMGYNDSRISDLSKRTLKQAKKVLSDEVKLGAA